MDLGGLTGRSARDYGSDDGAQALGRYPQAPCPVQVGGLHPARKYQPSAGAVKGSKILWPLFLPR
jgi:hypothetical protein